MTRSAVVLGCVLPLVAVLSTDAMAQRAGASAAERDRQDGGGLAVPSSAKLVRLKSDLRNLAAAQETYFANVGRYAASFEEVRRYFTPSPDVRIRIQMVGSDAWIATAMLRPGFEQACLLKYGTADRESGFPICRSVTEIERMWGAQVQRVGPRPADPDGGYAVSSSAALVLLKSDLRNLATAQETYFANAGRYAASFEEFRRPREYFRPSPDVRIRIQVLGSGAWAATAHLTRPGFGQACLVTVGTANRDDGTPVCRSVTEIETMWGMLVRRTSAKPVDSAESVAPPLPKGFQIMTAPVDIPDVIPEIDLSKKLTKEADSSGRGVEEGVAACSREKPVAPIPGTGSPRYPEILLSAGVEGQVLAQFVVDTLGRVESDSFKVIRSDHELFSAAVRSAIPAMRFLPAECDGRKVKQLIQQPFDFNRRR